MKSENKKVYVVCTINIEDGEVVVENHVCSENEEFAKAIFADRKRDIQDAYLAANAYEDSLDYFNKHIVVDDEMGFAWKSNNCLEQHIVRIDRVNIF